MSILDQEKIKKVYRRYGRSYDLLFGSALNPGRRQAVEALGCGPRDRILEVGVGTGLSLPLYPKESRVVGIDLSVELLDQAKEKVDQKGLSQVEALLQMDAQNMTFPDNTFDMVVAMYVASVVPDPVQLVDEIRRVCKPQGKIIFFKSLSKKSSMDREV